MSTGTTATSTAVATTASSPAGTPPVQGACSCLESESLFREPHATFQRLLAFLELDPWCPPSYDNGSRHPAGTDAAVPARLAAELRAELAGDRRALQDRVDFDVSPWAA